MNIIFLLLLLGYYGVIYILNVQEIRKLKEIDISEKMRIRFYYEWILQGLIPVLAVFGIFLFTNISFYDIGFRQIGFYYNIWFTIITFVISGLILIGVFHQKYRHRIRGGATENMRNDSQEDPYNVILMSLIIPRNLREKNLFFYATLMDSFSGELVLRGFLFYNLQVIFPQLSIITILIVSSLIFGFLTSYGSIASILENTFYFVLFGCLFLITNSILPVIIFRFFIMFFGYPSLPIEKHDS